MEDGAEVDGGVAEGTDHTMEEEDVGETKTANTLQTACHHQSKEPTDSDIFAVLLLFAQIV